MSERHVESISVRQAPRWSVERLRARAAEWLAQPDIRAALLATLALRAFCSLVAAAVPLLVPSAYPWLDPYLRDHFQHATYVPGTPLPTYGLLDYLTQPWARWDTSWYTDIAYHGYATYGSTAFMPLYPLAIRCLLPLVGGEALLAGLVISTVAAFFVFLALFRFAEWFAPRRGLGPYTLLVAVMLPTAFFLMAAYTESLYLALAFWAILAALGRRWGRVALLGALATLTRQQGILLAALAVPTLWLTVTHTWRRLRRPPSGSPVGSVRAQEPVAFGWGPLLAAAVPLLVYAGWILVLRYGIRAALPWELLVSAQAWKLRFTWPGAGMLVDVTYLLHPPAGHLDLLGGTALDALATAVGVIALVAARPRLPLGLWIYLAAVWCSAIIKTLPSGLTVSEGRYMLGLLPLCVLPATWLARGGAWRRLAWVALGTSVLTLYLFVFVLYGWVA